MNKNDYIFIFGNNSFINSSSAELIRDLLNKIGFLNVYITLDSNLTGINNIGTYINNIFSIISSKCIFLSLSYEISSDDKVLKTLINHFAKNGDIKILDKTNILAKISSAKS